MRTTCIIKEGEKWAKCPDHKNINGEHGMYMCVHQYTTNKAYNAPQYCRLMDNQLSDDLFYLEK